MSEITNGELMAVLLDIKGRVGQTDGKLAGFIEETRANRHGDRQDAAAQDDRLITSVSALATRVGALEGKDHRSEGKTESIKEHRGIAGYFMTWLVAVATMFAAWWSGVLHQPH